MLLEKALGRGGPTSIPRCVQYRYVKNIFDVPMNFIKKKKRTVMKENEQYTLQSEWQVKVHFAFCILRNLYLK
jgi:hypothetical protein